MKVVELNYKPTMVQKKFHKCECDEVLFGGAAGGGKSFAIVMDAIDRCLRQENISAYIFRRTYKELNDSIINIARQMLPSCLGKYNSSRHELMLINGSCIKFRHMQRESDKYRYQGAEINILYIDELTHFSKSEYDFLKSRLRANKSKKILPIVRCTSNPGGIGHAWVKSYFIDGCAPEEVFEEEIKSSVLEKSRVNKRVYIPAKVMDNPHINDEYIFELENKPKALKDALLHGRWDAFEGQVFSEWRDVPEFYTTRRHTHVIEPFKIPDHFPKFRSFDFGYSRPFSVLWWAVGEDDEVYLYKEWYGATSPNVGLKISPAQIAQGILERDGEDKIECSFADPSIWDSSRGESVALQMEKEGVFFLPGENARLSGKMAVHERLKFDENGKCGMQVFKTCREFIRAVPAICYSSINPEDVNTDGEDHSYDAMRYFLMNRIHGKKDPIKNRKVFNPLEENQKFIDDFREV